MGLTVVSLTLEIQVRRRNLYATLGQSSTGRLGLSLSYFLLSLKENLSLKPTVGGVPAIQLLFILVLSSL